MNKKIIGILVVTLMIGTAFPVMGMVGDMGVSEVNRLITENCDEPISSCNYNGDTLDQQQPNDCGWGQGAWDGAMLAQSFIPTLESLTKVELRLFRKGNPDGLTVSIRNDLLEDDLNIIYVDAEEISANTNWHEFDLTDITLVPGQEYYIVWKQEGGGDGDNALYWAYGKDNSYESGVSWIYLKSWELFNPPNQNDPDFCFKTYGKVYCPSKPETPIGPEEGEINEEMTYSTSATDPMDKQVFYKWDWGDGTISDWDGPYGSGETISASHAWTEEDIYIVKVKAENSDDLESGWSDPIIIGIPVKNEGIDQTQESNSGHGYGAWSGSQLAQGFVPTQNTLTSLDLLIFKKGNPKGLTVSIRKDLYDEDLVTSYVQASELDEELKAEWITFNFEDVDLNAGEKYYIIWEQDGGDSNNVIYWTFGTDNPYIYGISWINTGSWEEFNPAGYPEPDFCFKTYHAKDKAINTPFLRFLENHLHMFPLLRQLLNL